MKKKLLFLPFILAIACNSNNNHKPSDNHQEHHKHHKSEHSSANEHMHQSSVEELIKRFESPDRDEYQQPEKVMEYLGDINGLTIMDIGAGSGYFSVKLAEKGARVIAADVDQEFQDYLQNRIQENNIENIELRKIPYDSPSLSEREVDIVFIVNTYHHIEKRVEYFQKVKKGTKEEGGLIIIDFFKTELAVGPPVGHKISMDKVINELKKSGYNSFEVNVNLLPYQYIIKAS